MRNLAEGIMATLSGMYGQENVFNGRAELDVDVPYVTFTLEASGETMQFAGATSASQAGITDYPVRVSCWCRTYSQASLRLEEIITELTAQPAIMKTAGDKIIMTTVSSREIIEELFDEQDSTRVYRGYALIEFKVNQGAIDG